MRKLIATVFNYSLDGLLADEGTEFWKFCFDLPENREPDDPAQLDFLAFVQGPDNRIEHGLDYNLGVALVQFRRASDFLN